LAVLLNAAGKSTEDEHFKCSKKQNRVIACS